MELTQTLGIALLVSLGINLVMFIPAFIWKTDKLTDISYAVTFMVVALFGFFISDKSLIAIILLAMDYSIGSYFLDAGKDASVLVKKYIFLNLHYILRYYFLFYFIFI